MDFETAIARRAILSFTYDGLPRIVQPATYGVTTTGRRALRACQIAGESHRNTIPGWALFSEDKMVDVAATGGTFPAFALSGYTRGDSAFTEIVAEL